MSQPEFVNACAEETVNDNAAYMYCTETDKYYKRVDCWIGIATFPPINGVMGDYEYTVEFPDKATAMLFMEALKVKGEAQKLRAAVVGIDTHMDAHGCGCGEVDKLLSPWNNQND